MLLHLINNGDCNELNTVLVQLRTELRGLQTGADGAGIAIMPLADA